MFDDINSSDEFGDDTPPVQNNKERYLDDEVVSDHPSYSADVSWTDNLEAKTQPGESR
jgi:hypothetical protein